MVTLAAGTQERELTMLTEGGGALVKLEEEEERVSMAVMVGGWG